MWTRALNQMSSFLKTVFGSAHSSVIYVHTEKSRYFPGDMVTFYLFFYRFWGLILFYVHRLKGQFLYQFMNRCMSTALI